MVTLTWKSRRGFLQTRFKVWKITSSETSTLPHISLQGWINILSIKFDTDDGIDYFNLFMIYLFLSNYHKKFNFDMDPQNNKTDIQHFKGKYVLGIEGSANKIGIGVVDFEGKIYSNPR